MLGGIRSADSGAYTGVQNPPSARDRCSFSLELFLRIVAGP
jgi:hypothetical protein